MGLFSKTPETLATNAINYCEELIIDALRTYRNEKENIVGISEEEGGLDNLRYKRQCLSAVQRRAIIAINSCKAIFENEDDEIVKICKELEDDVVVLSPKLFENSIDKKLKELLKEIREAKKDLQ